MSYQIGEAETEIAKLKTLIAEREKDKEAKAIGEDSFMRDLEKNFCNVGNMGFQAISPRFRQRKLEASIQGTQGARSLSGLKQGSTGAQSSHKKQATNHPNVDPRRLSREQALEIATHIRKIKDLEKQYEGLNKEKLQIKEQQNRVHKQRKEQQEVFDECLMECVDYILKQREISSYRDAEKARQTGSYFFELYKNRRRQGPTSKSGNKDILPKNCYYQSKSNVMDGHTNNILYQTIKQIVAKAKQEKKMENIRELKIDWEEFKEFSNVQSGRSVWTV